MRKNDGARTERVRRKFILLFSGIEERGVICKGYSVYSYSLAPRMKVY